MGIGDGEEQLDMISPRSFALIHYNISASM